MVFAKFVGARAEPSEREDSNFRPPAAAAGQACDKRNFQCAMDGPGPENKMTPDQIAN